MSYIVPLGTKEDFHVFEHTNGPDDTEHVKSAKATSKAGHHDNKKTAAANPKTHQQPGNQLSKKQIKAANKAAGTAGGQQHGGAKNTPKQGTPPANVNTKKQRKQAAAAAAGGGQHQNSANASTGQQSQNTPKQGKAKRITKKQRKQAAAAAAAGGGQPANTNTPKSGTAKKNTSQSNTADADDTTEANVATKSKGLLSRTKSAAASTFQSAKGGAAALNNARYKSSVISLADLPNQQVYYVVKGQNNTITYFGHITGPCVQARKNETVDVRFTEFRREQQGKLFGTSKGKKFPLVHPSLIQLTKKLSTLHLVGGDPKLCISMPA